MEFRFVLDKRGREKREIYLCRKQRKMNRGIWRHKSVSDRLKGWNRERTDTLVGFLKWWLTRRYERGIYDSGKQDVQKPNHTPFVLWLFNSPLLYSEICIYCVPPSRCFLLTLKFPSGINRPCVSQRPCCLSTQAHTEPAEENPGTSPCRTFKLLQIDAGK